MRSRVIAVSCAAALMLGIGCLAPTVRADVQQVGLRKAQDDALEAPAKAEIKPEIAALIKRSTALYMAIKSYRHTAEYVVKGQGTNGEFNSTEAYTLALERPNKFIYRSDTPNGSAAVSDGKTFINHRNDNAPGDHEHTYYTKTTAPASYKGINIVDDVTFRYGTYMIALMLQGDVLADNEVKTGLEQATLRAGVMENGKKYDVLSVPFVGKSNQQRPVQFFFDADTHLLHKAVEEFDLQPGTKSGVKIIEIIESVLIDKPLPAGTFDYKPPKSARLIVSLPSRADRKVAVARQRQQANETTASGRAFICIGPPF